MDVYNADKQTKLDTGKSEKTKLKHDLFYTAGTRTVYIFHTFLDHMYLSLILLFSEGSNNKILNK